MTIRNLDHLFDPRSVAVIGASDRPASVGATVWRNLRHGRFDGPVWAVNPGRDRLGDDPVHRSVADLPEAPDLAVICTPAPTVPGLVADLAARGTRAAVVLTAGLDAATKQAMLDAARPSLLRILGPNCIGLLAPHRGLNASFAHVDATPGDIAFVSQSGALMTALLDWAGGRGIGFSHFASIGESADVDFGDLIDWLASDPRTKSILLYVESIRSPRKFMSAARAAARNKPLIVVKAGRSAQGQAAARSHTGALAGSDAVFDAAIRRAGGLRVPTLQDLFLAAETLARGRRAAGAAGPVPNGFTDVDGEAQAARGLVILTNGGGAGVMAADEAAARGVPLATLAGATVARLDAALPAVWSRANPVDIIGDAPAARYVAALEGLLDDPATDALLFIQAPTAIVSSTEVARALVPLARRAEGRFFACWLGDTDHGAVAGAVQVFREAGIPVYATPEEAVRAVAMQVDYRRHQALLLQAPATQPPAAAPEARETIAATVRAALADGREMLTEPEAKAVLAAAGIPVVATRTVALAGDADDPAAVAACADAAVAAAGAIGWPVALKLLSHAISHKSDVGGVALNLATEAALRDALGAMAARVRRLRPDADIAGFTVQAMVRRGHARELIVGASLDPMFGPVVLFGQGGTSVEVVGDRALALPPLNEPLARDLVDRTRVAKLLAAWRDTPAADRDALHRVLVAVSDLLAAVPELAELDINPLLVDADGAIALDARIRLDASRPAGAAHFAIRPYPIEQVRDVDWNGRHLTLRPVRPGDEAQHLAFLQSLDPEDLRMRIFHSRRTIAPSELARLVKIDYARESAIVAVERSTDGTEATLGVVRAVTDPDNRDAEFGVIVRSELKGRGLGELLLGTLVGQLRAQGTQRLVGTVLDGNAPMIALARRLGFSVGVADGDGVRALVLALQPGGRATEGALAAASG